MLRTTNRSVRLCVPFVCVLLIGIWPAHTTCAADEHIELDVTLSDGNERLLRGRVIARQPDGGLLLEDASGTISSITADGASTSRPVEADFQFLSDEQMAELLIRQMGATFTITQTEHFILCSQAHELYTEYCGKLLERVHEQYYEFLTDRGIPVEPLTVRLPVIVFRAPATLREFAVRQHPETDFSTVPGYYSIRHNQMLISGAAAGAAYRRSSDVIREVRKHRRDVETVVHEAVHQLAFNSGLQIRYADNPMWLSEGLAVYFESTAGRAALGWSRPGEVSRLHLPTLKTSRPLAALPVSLTALSTSVQSFQVEESAAYAYAESWAVIHYLAVRRKEGLVSLLGAYQSAKPAQRIPPENHIAILEEAFGEPLAEAEDSVLKHIQRLRKPR